MSAASGVSSANPSADRKYKFYREDFGPLVTRPLHLDLTFDIIESRVTVTQNVTFLYSGDAPMTELVLNSADLSVASVARFTEFKTLGLNGKDFVGHVASLAGPVDLAFTVADSFLTIALPVAIQSGEEFVLRTVSTATPTDHILEGLYYDYTPEGCPKTIITQCQQYGFQRIVPCIDTMTAKASYTTTIIADKRYSNVITNGDLAPGYFNEDGTPCPKEVSDVFGASAAQSDVEAGLDRKVLRFHNHLVTMAPYVFFLGVGTYITYRRTLEYPDGAQFLLELLVLPGLTEPRHCRTSVNMLHDSIQWTHMSTGAQRCELGPERARIYSLMAIREALKERLQGGLITASNEAPLTSQLSGVERDAAEAELVSVRAQLAEAYRAFSDLGYKYTGAIYREIAMENSDYGGMENVGNTTILSSRLTPADQLSDGGYVYMEGVKVHEFYHNINGSEVTGQSPFEIWLNEAVTVHVQRQREDELFGHDFMRLQEVLYAFTPAVGPLASDLSPVSMSIEPEGFNRTQELISAMTYSKAPEVVAMVQTLMSEPLFVRGLALYHARFRYSNATTSDWVDCMEEVMRGAGAADGLRLHAMTRGWLKRTGHPRVEVSGAYDAAARTYTMSMRQTGWEDKPEEERYPWDFPVSWALVKGNSNVKEGVFRFDAATAELVVTDVLDAPDFFSFARDWSFFGSYRVTGGCSDPEVLELQARNDPDTINRYFAYRALADAEKAKIVEALRDGRNDVTVSPRLIALHLAMLQDESVSPSTRAMVLHEAEAVPSRPDLAHLYRLQSDAKTALLQATWDAGAAQIDALFRRCQASNVAGPHLHGLHERALKRHCAALAAAGSRPSVLSTRQAAAAEVGGYGALVESMARDLLASSFMSDKVAGLSLFMSCTPAPADRDAVHARVRDAWCAHPVSAEEYIRVMCGLDCDDAPALIRQLMNAPIFNVNLAGHARSATRSWAGIRKRALMTDEGLELTVWMFLKVGKVNQMSVAALISAFGDLDKFEQVEQVRLVRALRSMRAGLDEKKEESLCNQLKMMLAKYTSLDC